MSIGARIINFDNLFQFTTTEPIVVNNFNVNTAADKERLNQLIYTHYEGDALSVLPSCECLRTTGEYNVGIRCEHCNTVVMSVTERPLESVLWIEPPEGVATFINPQVWTIFSQAMSQPGINLFEWMVNPATQLPANLSKMTRKLQSLNIERGINFFYENFDEIFNILLEEGIIGGTKKRYREDMINFVREYRDCIFAKRLPIPSKLGFVTEQTVTATYADLTMLPAIDAIRTISSTVNSPAPLSLRVKQSRAMRANALLAEYHENFKATALSSKEGWFRKHVFGSRLHFTFRAVINSLSDNHEYDELHLPWSMAVMAYKVHLTSKLIKRGFTPNQCARFIHEHTLKYHPLMDDIFQEMIAESPSGGMPVTFARN